MAETDDFRDIMGMGPSNLSGGDFTTIKPQSPKPKPNRPSGPKREVLENLVLAAADRYGVPRDMAHRLVTQESGYNPAAVSEKGAIGLTQLLPDTAKSLGVDPHDPEQNIDGGMRYYAAQHNRFGSWPLAAAAYHAGPEDAIAAYNNPKGNPKTAAYVKNVAGDQPDTHDEFRTLMGMPTAGASPQAAPQAADAPAGQAQLTPEQEARFKELTDPQGVAPAAAAPGKPADPSAIGKAGNIPIEGGGRANDKQNDTLMALYRGRAYDENAEPGSMFRPMVLTAGSKPETLPDGAYYIDEKGDIQKTGPVEGGVGSRLFGGFGRGMSDVGQSIMGFAPKLENEVGTVFQTLNARQKLFEAGTKGDLISGGGRLLGQVAGSAPAMVAAGEGLGMLGASRLLGPVGEFIAGNAGKGVASGAGRLGARGASLAARGAVEGTEAAALTNQASDAPLSEQLLTGAVLGGALAPVATGAAKLGAKIVGPKAAAGALPAAEQEVIFQTAEGLPVPVRLTGGQISGSAGQQMAENAMLRGGKGPAAEKIMQEGAQEAQDALRANVPAIQSKMTGAAPVGSGEGGAAVSGKLNTMFDEAKRGVDANYRAARDVGGDAMLASGKEGRDAMIEAVRTGYDLDSVPRVAKAAESFGENGSPTVREMFDTRTKLSNLTQSSDTVEAGAAKTALRSLDGHMEHALENDLFLGDPTAVEAWKKAVASRREMGKLFEGKDFIEAITKRERHGEGVDLKKAPEEVANFIFGANELSLNKPNFTRDMKRLKEVVGPDSEEWGALRAEAFGRLARAAGPTDKPFSGAGFQTAWSKAKDRSPQALEVLFSPEEIKLIDNFADVARRATVPVKGGDNPSNSGVYVVAAAKKFLESLGTITGGGVGSAVGGPGGAAVGAGAGKAFDNFMKDMVSVRAAQKAVSGKPIPPPKPQGPVSRLTGELRKDAAIVGANRLIGSSEAPAGQ